MDNSVPRIQSGDPAVVNAIVGQLKSQGIFDEFRRDCIADVDTKPAYQNLRQRVEIYVSKFLSQQTWCTDLNKNQLRDNLRRSINESGVLAWGIDHLVEQIVTPKIYRVFYPQIEAVVKEYLGLENRQPTPNAPVPPPGTTELPDRSFEAKPAELKEETKTTSKELPQCSVGSKAPVICSAGVNEQHNIGDKGQISANVCTKTSNELPDAVNTKAEEIPIPVENKEDGAESTNTPPIKSEAPDSVDASLIVASENKEEPKKATTDKKIDQDNCSLATEKSRSTKDKENKLKRERTSSECSERDRSLNEKKDHTKVSSHKKSGTDSAKTDKEKKLKAVDREKQKPDSGRAKDVKKNETEKCEKKQVHKTDSGKSGTDTPKLKHSKSSDGHKKTHKTDGLPSKPSSQSTEPPKCHKSDKTKLDSNSKPKSVDQKSCKLEKTDKSKAVKSESKGKVDQENSKPRSDSKHKSNDSLHKSSKHSSESKTKHSEHKVKSSAALEKSMSKPTVEKKPPSGQKLESSEKIRHSSASEKKHLERSKSIDLSEESSKSEYPDAKRIKLDLQRKSEKHSSSHSHSHSKHSSEKEKKGDLNKDSKNKAHVDKHKSSKSVEKPKSSQEKTTDSVKTDKEKTAERKNSSSSDKLKPTNSSDKPKSSSNSDKQKHSNSGDKHRKQEDYKHSKEKKEKIREMKREKSSTKVKAIKEESEEPSKSKDDLRTSNEGYSVSKDDASKLKQMTDYYQKEAADNCQKWKIQCQEGSDKKDCEKQSPCCNFSPEACSESESHSSKGSDILLNIRPVLGVSPSQDNFCENVDGGERSKPISDPMICPRALDTSVEDAEIISSDESEDNSKITQDGKGGCIIKILNDDIEDGAWSDVTISSVHTSDLSSFDDRISLSSSEEEIEEENSQKEKKRVPLKEIKKMTECGGIDRSHDTSFSDDEKHKEKTKPTRKRTSSEKSSDSSFSRCFDIVGGKKEVSNVEPKVEHKWELRRQRKINPRYASEEFSSIFNSSKWSYSNNLDIGDSNNCDSTEKTPARKSSHGSRGDVSYHIDGDTGTNQSSNIERYEVSDNDRKRKRSRVRSESVQEEKGLATKRQKLKEESASDNKEQFSYLGNEESGTEDSENNSKSNKMANLNSQEGKNIPTMHNDPAMATDICLEGSKVGNGKQKRDINLNDKNGSSSTDICHPDSSAIEQIETDEAVTVKNDTGGNANAKNNLAGHGKQIISPPDDGHVHYSLMNKIHSESGKPTNTASDCTEIRTDSDKDSVRIDSDTDSKDRNIFPSDTCDSHYSAVPPCVKEKSDIEIKPSKEKHSLSLHDSVSSIAEAQESNSVQCESNAGHSFSSPADVCLAKSRCSQETNNAKCTVEAKSKISASKNEEDKTGITGDTSPTDICNKRTNMTSVEEDSCPVFTSSSDIPSGDASVTEDFEIRERTNISPLNGEGNLSPLKSDTVDSTS